MASLPDPPARDHLFLDGDIEFEENASPFARGGFGQLFVGTTRTHGKVAMKRLRTLDESIEKLKEQHVKTLTEARVWRALSHKHILPFLGVLFKGLDVYLVSPFVENGSLSAYLESEPEADRILLLYQIADGLVFLHAQGVVHGDVKGQNVLIEHGPRAMLCDFGLSKIPSTASASTGHGLGTVRWQSPELMEGGPRTFESDVYAFGITIHEILSGKLPFHGILADAAMIVAVVIRNQRPFKDDMLGLARETKEAVWKIVENCWMKDPQSRLSMPAVCQAIACLGPLSAHESGAIESAEQATGLDTSARAFMDARHLNNPRLEKRPRDRRDSLPQSDPSNRPLKYARVHPANEMDSPGMLASPTVLQRLAYSDGASWKPESVCASNTRTGFLSDVRIWIQQPAPDRGPRIFLLSSVAGSGKSAVAHSVAQISAGDRERNLASSFFFDREVAGRNTPERFLSNLAVDLSSYDPQCGAHMSCLLHEDPSLARSSMQRLFDELIIPSVNASDRCRNGRPIVVVVDALDEGRFDIRSLQIIRDGALKLPDTFRFFLTSRPHPSVDHVFRSSIDVRRCSFDLISVENASDIREFVKQQCLSVADELGLDARWPGPVTQEQLIAKAEGLFVWIAVVFGYIRDPEKTCDPEDRLASLLEDGESIGLGPGEKMDRLFKQILDSCPWGDRQFPSAFNRVVGTLVALETPLSPAAFASYLGDGSAAIINRVRSLSPLIAGLYGDRDTVRFIHLSVREFLTSAVSVNAQFFVDKDRANERLALKCLEILNQDLPDQVDGVGFLTMINGEEGVPYTPTVKVAERLRYACNFWKAHTTNMQDPISPKVNDAVNIFCASHLIAWIELSASLGQLQSLEKAPLWVQKCLVITSDREGIQSSERYSDALYSMHARLDYDARVEEGFQAIKETVAIRRDLTKVAPDKFGPRLADAFIYLSNCYSRLGQREEALDAIQKAVVIRRELARKQPAMFNQAFARSLNNLAIYLSHMGKQEEALISVEESVVVYQELVKEEPAKFNTDFAMSLNTLSNRLYYLGQKEEALGAIRQAVAIDRELARGNPTVYNPALALELNNLSNRLLNVGQHKEALEVIQEALTLHRKFAKERPATFNPELASDLVTFSFCLRDDGRKEEALNAMEEAVTIYRDLAKERPAAFHDDLAISLNHLSFGLSALRRHEEALQASMEDVTIRRQLARERPAVFNSRLVGSLKMLSWCFKKVDRREDARLALEEAESLSP